MSTVRQKSGWLLYRKGDTAEEAELPESGFWDVCRICCGLSRSEWSAIAEDNNVRSIMP